MKKAIGVIFLVFLMFSCYQEQAIPVLTDFTVTVEDNDHSVPVRISLKNQTTGADKYHWTFEGGEPAEADTYNPGMVLFRNAGGFRVKPSIYLDDYTIQNSAREYGLFSKLLPVPMLVISRSWLPSRLEGRSPRE